MYKGLVQTKCSSGKRDDAVEDDMHYFSCGIAVLILKRLQFSKLPRGRAMQYQHSKPDKRSDNTNQ